VPYDGDPKALDQTAIPLAEVVRMLSQTKAKDVLAVVDSCFSGAGGRSVLPMGARPLVRVAEPQPVSQVLFFTAASGAEISGPAPSDDGGLFSKLVAEGAGSGQADMDGDGQITVQELVDWVRPRVSREARLDNREQTPAVVAGSSASASSFVLAYGLPAK
jgi:hypothetical protein